jgi:hypothetical protein
MELPSATKPAAWGAVIGAIGCAVVGFSWLGWEFGSTAEKQANQRAEAAVVVALTLICVAKFQGQTDATTKLAEFNKVASSWDRRSLIEKGGWAAMPGSTTTTTSAVAAACAEKLGSAT